MKALTFVWGFVAFTILGLDFLSKTDSFDALQDFESNFKIDDYPGDFLPNWSANAVRSNSSRVFQAVGEGVNGSRALGIQAISSFNAEIYIKTTTKGLNSNRFSLKAKTKRNGSGSRPVYLFYSFSGDGQVFANRQQIGDNETFKNEDSDYSDYEAWIPESMLEKEILTIKLEVNYGQGTGSAARLFIDDFLIHGLLEEGALEPLQIVAIEKEQANSLVVQFNQPIVLDGDQIPALNKGYGPARQVLTEGGTLWLEFDDYLYSNQYELRFSGLASAGTGETWTDKTHAFEIISPTPAGAILINELMADPNPKGLAPEEPVLPQGASYEYIELLNTTDKPIWLKGFSYNGGAIEEVTVAPGEHVLLCSPSHKELFSSFGNTAAVTPFRTLPNSSGHIAITDALAKVVDSLSYSQAWYDLPEKRSGGWALERVNPYQPCSDHDNWRASAAPQGGTPGRSNSVFNHSPDSRPFMVNEIRTISPREMRLSFTKAVPVESFLDAVFMLNGEKPDLEILDLKTIILVFASNLTSGQSYQLHIRELNDCSGMPLLENSYPFIYDGEGPKISRIASLSPNELLVFFNEAVHPTTAEQASNYQINQVADLVTSASLTDSTTIHLTLKQALELNRHHRLVALELQDLTGNIRPEFATEFLMDDQLDTVAWAGPNLLDLYFHSPLDSASTVVKNHFILDRGLGSPVSSFINVDNRNQVHLIFEENLPVNTPLTLTVKNLKNASGQFINSHKKTVLFDNRAIAVNALQVSDAHTVHLLFNKPLHPNFATSKTNYVINREIGHPLEVQLIRADSVILKMEALAEGQEYTLSISGLQDLIGIRMTRTLNRDFAFDLTGPSILEAFLESPFDIRLIASEAVALPAPDQMMINASKPERVKALASNELLVSSASEMTANLIHVSIQNLADLHGNRTEAIQVNIQNDQVKLGGSSIITEDLIQLTFTQKMDPDFTLLPDKYLINDQTPEEVKLQDNEYEVWLSLRNSLLLRDSVLIEVHPIKSLHGKEGQAASRQLWYDDLLEDLFMINSQLIQLVHTDALDRSAAANGIYRVKDLAIQLQPIINQSDPRVLQLALSHPLNPDTAYELILPPRLDHMKRLIPGSTRHIIYDMSPPQLTAVEAISDVEVLVSFDEALDPILSLVPSFYDVNGKVPVEVISGEQSHQIVLVFDVVFEKELPYLLTVKQLEDLHRNAIDEDALTFYFDGPVTPAYKELIINEIMAAPRSGNELPEAEYVELFNASEKEIALGGLIFANSRSSAVLPRGTLLPGELVLLTASSHRKELEPYGPILGLAGWPTLLNGADELKLLDRSGNLLDEVQYTTASYGSSEKAQGGYSLERVNPFSSCPDVENLKPSDSPLRGTPGKVNSVFDASPDQQAPALQKAEWREEKEIILQFSKRINDDLEQVKISSTPALPLESFKIDEDNHHWLVLTLSEPLEQNMPYKITVKDLRDCPGNLIDPLASSATLILPQEAKEGDIVINEILFNPKTGYPKFVEIYNQASGYIDLQGWKLANIANDEPANRKVVAEEQLIIPPFSFLVFTTDASLLKQAYPRGEADRFVELSSLPSYPQSKGSVLLLNPDETDVERFDYDEKFHHALLDEVRGISLERISLETHVNEPKNWQSASANTGYATPGYKNSHARGESLLEKGIMVSPQVFVPDAPGEQHFTVISYQMEEPGLMATLRIYSVTGQLIKELCQNDLWGTSGFYTWDGTNSSGGKVRPGYYIVWVELLRLDGLVENIKKTVVVGAKF